MSTGREQTNQEKEDALRAKSIAVTLRRGYRLKMGGDGRGRDHTIDGPKDLTLDGMTVMNNIIKFENRNGIRKELGLPQKAMQRSLRDKMEEVQVRRRASEDARFLRIAEEAARNVLTESNRRNVPNPRAEPKKGRGKNRAIRGPARDR